MWQVVIFLRRHPWIFAAVFIVSCSAMMFAVLNDGRWEVLAAAGGALVLGWVAGSISTFNAIVPEEEVCDLDDTDR